MNLRPVSYTDDLEGFYDAVWLAYAQPLIEAYSGSENAGGKYDAVLMVISIVVALQMGCNAKIRTLLQKADLLHGHDLAWRDAIRLHLRRAGLRGRLWLAADAALGCDTIRVRLGSLVAPVAHLLDFGVGQGRRASTHNFSLLGKALVDSVKEMTCPIGLDPHPAAVRAYHSHTSQTITPNGPEDLNYVQETASQEATLARMHPDVPPWDQHLDVFHNTTGKLCFLDAIANHQFQILQFVDDSFVLQSSEMGVAAVNRGLRRFCALWRHRFQSGRKGPTVLVVGHSRFLGSSCGVLCDVLPQSAESLDVLGIDRALTFQGLLDERCGRLCSAVRQLVAGLADRGVGLPFQVAEIAVPSGELCLLCHGDIGELLRWLARRSLEAR